MTKRYRTSDDEVDAAQKALEDSAIQEAQASDPDEYPVPEILNPAIPGEDEPHGTLISSIDEGVAVGEEPPTPDAANKRVRNKEGQHHKPRINMSPENPAPGDIESWDFWLHDEEDEEDEDHEHRLSYLSRAKKALQREGTEVDGKVLMETAEVLEEAVTDAVGAATAELVEYIALLEEAVEGLTTERDAMIFDHLLDDYCRGSRMTEMQRLAFKERAIDFGFDLSTDHETLAKLAEYMVGGKRSPHTGIEDYQDWAPNATGRDTYDGHKGVDPEMAQIIAASKYLSGK
jgi:hypothetical protein